MEIPESLISMLEDSLGKPSELSSEERAKMHAENHNSLTGSLNDNDGYGCKVCKNKGTVAAVVQIAPDVWDIEFQECRCMKVRASIRNMERSGLKNLIKTYTFERFEDTEDWQKKIKSAAMEYAEGGNGWFFLGGQSGSGKTHICTAICRKFLLDGKPVQYMLWRDDIVRMKAAVNDEDAYRQMIDRFKSVKVLYIDDLFKSGKRDDAQQPTVADVNIAFEILNYRYNDPELLTVISSELTINEIISIDEAVGGRIYERSKVFNIDPDSKKNFRLIT